MGDRPGPRHRRGPDRHDALRGSELGLAERGHARVKRRDLAGRVVVVTGASSGIGAATAIACGRAGMRRWSSRPGAPGAWRPSPPRWRRPAGRRGSSRPTSATRPRSAPWSTAPWTRGGGSTSSSTTRASGSSRRWTRRRRRSSSGSSASTISPPFTACSPRSRTCGARGRAAHRQRGLGGRQAREPLPCGVRRVEVRAGRLLGGAPHGAPGDGDPRDVRLPDRHRDGVPRRRAEPPGRAGAGRAHPERRARRPGDRAGARRPCAEVHPFPPARLLFLANAVAPGLVDRLLLRLSPRARAR